MPLGCLLRGSRLPLFYFAVILLKKHIKQQIRKQKIRFLCKTAQTAQICTFQNLRKPLLAGLCAVCAIYAVYFYAHEGNKKEGGKGAENTAYIMRTRARKNTAQNAQNAQSPAQPRFAGRGKSAYLCILCGVVISRQCFVLGFSVRAPPCGTATPAGR